MILRLVIIIMYSMLTPSLYPDVETHVLVDCV